MPMNNPLAILQIAAIAAPILGELFGDDDVERFEVPPYVVEAMNKLKERSESGIGEGALRDLQSSLTQRLANEFGGIGARTTSALTRAGAGIGVQQQALQELDTKRLAAVGEGQTQINLANEEAKLKALGDYSRIAAQLAGIKAGFEGQQLAREGSAGLGMFGGTLGLLTLLDRLNKKSKGNSSNVLLEREDGIYV